MFKGTVQSLQISKEKGSFLTKMEAVRALSGRGLEGDRYCGNQPQHETKNHITLIEAEALEALKRDYGIELQPEESRRNVTTRHVPLNHLVGVRFRIGEVLCEGFELCEPCRYLEKTCGKKVMRPLWHRGGLRAAILESGTIRVGDTVSLDPS